MYYYFHLDGINNFWVYRSCVHIGMVAAWHSEGPGFESRSGQLIIILRINVKFKFNHIVVYCMNFAKRCLNCHLPFESCLKFTLGYKPLELLFVSSSRRAPDSPMLDKITKYYFFQTLLTHLNLILYFPYSDVHCINIQLCLIFNT